MMACKAGPGNPRCEHKQNAKGTELYTKHGMSVACGYSGECKEQIEVK